MVFATFPMMQHLEEQIHQRTNRQVRNLSVELRGGRVVLRGQTTSYYVKQLAQQEVIGTLPADVRVENTITVGR
jgi:osmotically-inducible protein OsmY